MIKCPANYFGRGEDYDLSNMTPEEMTQYNKDFEEWEKTHPDDPVGERALADYKSSQTPGIPRPSNPQYVKKEENTFTDEDDVSAGRLRLSLPVEAIEKLKRYSKKNNRRPKDVVLAWIYRHC